MNWPSVSLCITTFDRRTQVITAISSAFRQKYRGPIEIVVCDDGSTDGTVIPAGVKLVRHEQNRGIAAAKNSALRAATGEFKGILDSDDFYEPTFVATCVARLLERPDIGLVYTDNHMVNSHGKRLRTDKALDWSLQGWLETCNLRGDSWLARAELVDRCPHDERFSLEADGDFFYQMAEIADFLRIPEPLMSVTAHVGRTSRDYLSAAYWHACALAKYGHSIGYAYARARRGNAFELLSASIEAGYAAGCEMARERAA